MILEKSMLERKARIHNMYLKRDSKIKYGFFFEWFFTLQVVKTPVMTICYGVTSIGARNQVKKHLTDRFGTKLNLNEIHRLSMFISITILEAVDRIFERAMKFKRWLVVSLWYTLDIRRFLIPFFHDFQARWCIPHCVVSSNSSVMAFALWIMLWATLCWLDRNDNKNTISMYKSS